MFIYDVLNEPPHLHITKNKKGYNSSAKIWLKSMIFAETGNFTDTELNVIEKVVLKNQVVLLASFEDVRKGKKAKTIKLKM